MNRSNMSNYRTEYAAGGQLTRALLDLMQYISAFPQNAAAILPLFEADVARVKAALVAAVPEEPTDP